MVQSGLEEDAALLPSKGANEAACCGEGVAGVTVETQCDSCGGRVEVLPHANGGACQGCGAYVLDPEVACRHVGADRQTRRCGCKALLRYSIRHTERHWGMCPECGEVHDLHPEMRAALVCAHCHRLFKHKAAQPSATCPFCERTLFLGWGLRTALWPLPVGALVTAVFLFCFLVPFMFGEIDETFFYSIIGVPAGVLLMLWPFWAACRYPTASYISSHDLSNALAPADLQQLEVIDVHFASLRLDIESAHHSSYHTSSLHSSSSSTSSHHSSSPGNIDKSSFIITH